MGAVRGECTLTVHGGRWTWVRRPGPAGPVSLLARSSERPAVGGTHEDARFRARAGIAVRRFTRGESAATRWDRDCPIVNLRGRVELQSRDYPSDPGEVRGPVGLQGQPGRTAAFLRRSPLRTVHAPHQR